MCHVRSSVLWSLSLFASTQKPETLTHSTSSFSDSSEPLLNAQPSSDGKGVFRGIKDRLTDSPQLKHCNHGWAWSGHKMRPICRGGLAENSLRNSSPEGRNKHNDSCIRCLSTQYVHTTGSHTRNACCQAKSNASLRAPRAPHRRRHPRSDQFLHAGPPAFS